MAGAVRREVGIRAGQKADVLSQRGPAPDLVHDDHTDDHDADREQDALQDGDLGDGAQTARGDIEEQHRGEAPHADIDAQQTIRQHMEQKARGTQLDAQIRHREHQGDQDDQQPDRVGAEVVRQHLARRHEAEALADDPLALEEQEARERDGNRVERHVGVREAVTVDQPRVAHKNPARERRRRGGQDEHPERNASPGDEVVACGAGGHRALDAPVDAVGPIQDHKDNQPDYLRFHRLPLVFLGRCPKVTGFLRCTGREMATRRHTNLAASRPP